MPSHRRFGRASSRLLPPQSSLYGALQTIIGNELRARYEPPRDTPAEIARLLTLLDEPGAFADTKRKDETGC